MSPFPNRWLGVPAAPSTPPTPPPVTPPSATVYTELDVILGNVSNPYPTDAYGARAFVSAEGYGAGAWASYRDGSAHVAFVTNLNGDTSPGSLRWAFEEDTGPRKIWPLAWGYVNAQAQVTPNQAGIYYTNVFRPTPSLGLGIRNGRTSKGGGNANSPTVGAGGFILERDDLVLRFAKIHVGVTKAVMNGLTGPNGIEWSNGQTDAITLRDGPGGAVPARIMLDHCTLAFSIDELLGSTSVDDHTAQHSWFLSPIDRRAHYKFFQSGVNHAMPVLYGYDSFNVSFHHNVIAHGRERTPWFKGGKGTFDGRCNYAFNVKKWGPFFSHEDRYDGSRPKVNWVKAVWQPGPFTDPAYWMLLQSRLSGYPDIYLERVSAVGFVSEGSDPWSAGILVRDGSKSDYKSSSEHDTPEVREEDTAALARDFNVNWGADRYVINPATGDLRDTRDFMIRTQEGYMRTGTGPSGGMDVTDVWNAPHGYDQNLPAGGITIAEFFSEYYNPWALSNGYPTGLPGFESLDDATGLYHHDLYEAWLTPHYPNLNGGGPVEIPEEPDFTLSLSTNDHYLKEAFLLGDTLWHLHKFTPAQRRTVLDKRVDQRFNLILGSTLVLDEPDFAGNNNPTASMSDSAWYQNMDNLMQEAEDRGLWYYVPVTWGGYAFKTTTVFASTTAAQTFGAWVANRYKHHKNLIWSPVNEWPEGDTSDPSDRIPYIDAIAAGIKSVISDAIITEHGVGQSFSLSSTQDWFGSEVWLTFNGIQTGPNFDYDYKRVIADFEASPTKPTVLLEGGYENSTKAGPLVITQRRQLWASLLSGAAGYGYGNEYFWQKKSGWQDHLDDDGTKQMQHALTFLEELSDPLNRTPDQNIFTDTNDEDDYTVRRTAMRDSGKAWLAVYLPSGGSVTVKLTTSFLTGSTYSARWFDTETGVFSNAGSGSLPQATKTFTAPSGTDTVLLVEAA